MPVRIPILQQRILPEQASQPRAQGSSFTGAVGESLSNLGNTAAVITERIQTAQRAMDLQNRIGMATADLAELELAATRDNDFRNAPARFTQGVKGVSDKYTKDLTDPVLRSAFEHEFGKLSLAKTINVKKDAFKQEVDYHRGQLDSNMEVYAQQAANAKNPAEQEFILNQARVALATAKESRFITDEDAVRRDKQFRTKLDENTVLRDINGMPEIAAQKLAGDPSYAQNLDPVLRQRMQATAQTRAGQARAAQQPMDARQDAEVAMQLNPTPPQGTRFQSVITGILKREGGYVAKDGASNAPANFGINQAANPDIDVKNLTQERAVELYRSRYWTQIDGDKLEPRTAVIAMDAAVNQGVTYAKQLLKDTGGDPQAMLVKREADYRKLAQDPKYAPSLPTWLNRLSEVRNEAASVGGQYLTATDVRASLPQWIANAENEANKRHPGDLVYRDLVVNRVKSYVETISGAQRAQQQQAHNYLSDVLAGTGNQPRPTTQDELFANPQARAAFSLIEGDARAGVIARLDHNAREANGQIIRSDPVVLTGLFDRIHAPDNDPKKITSITQLTPFFGRGLAPPDYDRLKKEIEEARTGGSGFVRDVNNVRKTANSMMKAGIVGRLMADTQPEKIEEASYAFNLELDQKIEAYRKAGKDPRLLITRGTPDYMLTAERVNSYLQNPRQVVNDAANASRAVTPTQQIGGAAPIQALPRVTNDAEFNALPKGARFVDPQGNIRSKP
jgi:hypothetical protein